MEGIFRLSGSEKRIKELKTLFDSPDRYGKGLVWDGYTVHDAANVLRRYLNDLPEPVVPLDLYEKFREPLRGVTKQPSGDGEAPQFVDNFDMDAAIVRYQQLITELPPLNRQLLLYILDLLAVFAAKSDENRMNSQNLAAIFQPGMLSHPNHAMAPEEYRLNQSVIIFLIENQDHFLIGMQGTAADETTMREVQKGTPVVRTPTTPTHDRPSGVARSLSNASAGAESVAKEGKIRRNKSTASRQSRHSNGAPSPGSPALAATPTGGGGLGRSNTVPSKKSPALQPGRFQSRNEPSSTPVTPLTPVTPSAATHVPRSPVVEEIATPHEGYPVLAAAGAAQGGFLGPAPKVDATTPSKERNLPSLFQRTPTGDSDKRPPNKLRKKKLPGSANPSAQSSTASLAHSAAASPAIESPNPLEVIPSTSLLSNVEASGKQPVTETPAEPAPRASHVASSNTLHPEAAENTLKPKMSPPTSLHSSFNEGSDIDQFDETVPGGEHHDKERRRRWRLSRRRDDTLATANAGIASPRRDLGQNTTAEASVTSVGSTSHKAVRSFTGESSEPPSLAAGDVPNPAESTSRDGKDESRGLAGWIKHKYREAKETAEQRRNKSPPADRPSAGTTSPPNQITSPLNQVTSPPNQITLPLNQITSPPNQTRSPLETNLPTAEEDKTPADTQGPKTPQ